MGDPYGVARDLIAAVADQLPAGYDLAILHALCAAALTSNGDFFAAIRSGKADVVTDEIDRFTATGILLKSGQVLDADIIVTATGFRISMLGGIAFDAGGKPVDPADTLTWRGMMFTDLPNFASVFGYLRAFWRTCT